MKNIRSKPNLLLILIVSFQTTTCDTLIPTTSTSARCFPGIIRFAYPKLTTLEGLSGAYIRHQKQDQRQETIFFQGSCEQNINQNIYTSQTLLAPQTTKSSTMCLSGSYLLGYTHSYQNTSKLDFINSSICSGLVLLPEFRKNQLGLPVGAALELGLFDWLNLGIREDLIFGFGKDMPIQNNFLVYAYADQPIKGLCLLVGLSATNQTSSKNDYKWALYTVHTALGLNLATETKRLLPRISLFCDYALGCSAATQASSRLGIAISTSF